MQTNEIFYGGTASLILSSTSSVVLYDIQQQKTLAEITTPPVKYVVWSADGSLVALLSKHSEYSPLLGRYKANTVLQRSPSRTRISRITRSSTKLSASSLVHGMTLACSSTPPSITSSTVLRKGRSQPTQDSVFSLPDRYVVITVSSAPSTTPYTLPASRARSSTV